MAVPGRQEEAVVGLGLDAPGPHLFGQAMGRGEDEVISLAEELDRSRGFASAPAAAWVAQAVPRQRVVVARRGAGSEVLFCCLKIRVGEVGCMFHGHVELLILVTPLGWGDRWKALLQSKLGTQSHFFHRFESLNPFKPL